jgi:hypothetical protein
LDSLKQLEHRVPILILSPTIIAQYGEPELDAPTMTAKFPSLHSVLNWCLNAKTISSHLSISISTNPRTGNLDVGLNVENEIVSLTTRFQDLRLQEDGSDGAGEVEMIDKCEVLVDLKKFTKILKVNVISPVTSVIHIYDHRLVRFNSQAQVGASTTSVTYMLAATSSQTGLDENGNSFKKLEKLPSTEKLGFYNFFRRGGNEVEVLLKAARLLLE